MAGSVSQTTYKQSPKVKNFQLAAESSLQKVAKNIQKKQEYFRDPKKHKESPKKIKLLMLASWNIFDANKQYMVIFNKVHTLINR